MIRSTFLLGYDVIDLQVASLEVLATASTVSALQSIESLAVIRTAVSWQDSKGSSLRYVFPMDPFIDQPRHSNPGLVIEHPSPFECKQPVTRS